MDFVKLKRKLEENLTGEPCDVKTSSTVMKPLNQISSEVT